MDDSDIQKFVLAQATTEVEHYRSWPPKIMAFYIAINFGIATALIALRSDICSIESCVAKPVITIAVLILAAWTIGILWKNHRNYLKYRKLQVFNQNRFLEKRKDEFGIPGDWLMPFENRALNRFLGWGFYAYIVVMTTALLIVGMWILI